MKLAAAVAGMDESSLYPTVHPVSWTQACAGFHWSSHVSAVGQQHPQFRRPRLRIAHDPHPAAVWVGHADHPVALRWVLQRDRLSRQQPLQIGVQIPQHVRPTLRGLQFAATWP